LGGRPPCGLKTDYNKDRGDGLEDFLPRFQKTHLRKIESPREVFMNRIDYPNQLFQDQATQKTNVILKRSGHGLSQGLVVILISMLFYSLPALKSEARGNPMFDKGGEIRYPASQFADGKAKFFQFKTPSGKTIRYFIVKSSDGVIRAAFDACDVCWPSGKGYVQQGDVMVCRNCGQRFPTPKVNIITGGCNPAALNRQLSKTEVILKVKDILGGQHYFDF
jgi:uncharacterized membrane protein